MFEIWGPGLNSENWHCLNWVSALPGNSTILILRPGLQKCFRDLADNPILKLIVFLMRWSGCRKISNLSYSSPVSIVPNYFSEPMNYYDEFIFLSQKKR